MFSNHGYQNARRRAVDGANAGRRSAPLGGRTYPEGAAGTQLANGLVLSGDDAPAFERAGYRVLPCHVQCSQELYEGSAAFPLDDYAMFAVERHSASLDDIARWTGAIGSVQVATGIYRGKTSRSVFGWMAVASIRGAHATLERYHDGFECFAVLTPHKAF